jgi:hypothetical protein
MAFLVVFRLLHAPEGFNMYYYGMVFATTFGGISLPCMTTVVIDCMTCVRKFLDIPYCCNSIHTIMFYYDFTTFSYVEACRSKCSERVLDIDESSLNDEWLFG